MIQQQTIPKAYHPEAINDAILKTAIDTREQKLHAPGAARALRNYIRESGVDPWDIPISVWLLIEAVGQSKGGPEEIEALLMAEYRKAH